MVTGFDMTLFAKDDMLSLEIESWRGFAECLPPNDKEEFLKMLGKLHDYSTAINAKVEPFPSEPVIMALLLEQHKLIRWLTAKFAFIEYSDDRLRHMHNSQYLFLDCLV
jgi:hypothetical protein